jgi:hypothetical protein
MSSTENLPAVCLSLCVGANYLCGFLPRMGVAMTIGEQASESY